MVKKKKCPLSNNKMLNRPDEKKPTVNKTKNGFFIFRILD